MLFFFLFAIAVHDLQLVNIPDATASTANDLAAFAMTRTNEVLNVGLDRLKLTSISIATFTTADGATMRNVTFDLAILPSSGNGLSRRALDSPVDHLNRLAKRAKSFNEMPLERRSELGEEEFTHGVLITEATRLTLHGEKLKPRPLQSSAPSGMRVSSQKQQPQEDRIAQFISAMESSMEKRIADAFSLNLQIAAGFLTILIISSGALIWYQRSNVKETQC
jgi:hypothetical protein